jgi:ATP-dependent RNA helicase DHX36
LYTRAREAELEEFKKPEVLRKRLEEVILQIKMLKLGTARTFLNKLMDKPGDDAITLGIERLISLHALDFEENLTPLGFHLAHLPMDPQTGKMILLGAIFSCVDPIFSIAASLTFKDAFYVPMGQERKVDQVRRELSDGTKSDHMVTVRAIEGYERAKQRNTERDYCYRNFISQSNLSMLMNLKNQFATYLYRMKFLPSTYYKEDECNKNSSNVGIITAVTAAGLYPNIAQVKMKGKKNPYPLVYTEEDGLVHIHPKSVNSKELTFECPFLVYHLKLKSSMIFLHDTTMVSPFPLLFFGGTLQYNREKGYGGTIVIDNGRIRFGCMEKKVFETVDLLRTELDKFLEHKISNPGPTNWAELSKEGLLLKAIIQLITAEYKMLMNVDDDDDFTSTEDDD